MISGNINFLKRFINYYFKPPTWEVIEERNTAIDLYYGGIIVNTRPAKLVTEKSNHGDIRYILHELQGFRKGKPYEVDINTGKPINER